MPKTSKTPIVKIPEALEEINEKSENSEVLQEVEDYTTDESEPLEKTTKKITGNNKPRTDKQKEAFKKCLEKRNEKIALNREKRLKEIAEVGEIKKLLKEKREVKFLKQPEELPLKEVLSDVEKPAKEVKTEPRKLKRTKVIYLPTSSSEEDEEEIQIKKIKNKSPVKRPVKSRSVSTAPIFRNPMPFFV
jgi:hypothetical protein